jgi:fructose-1,6-bisphosphatase I/sedoheptulose-1,7-bisphosphatase
MPLSKRFTLTQYLIEERRRYPGASGDFNSLILDVALACKGIAKAVAFGELAGIMGNHEDRGGWLHQCAGRNAKEARRALQRCLHPPHRVGRQPGRHGV